MALKKNMTNDEMVQFIDNELLPQVTIEIGNWIHPEKKQGGYFVVTRQVFCMVDFLGAVYKGYPLKERKEDKKKHLVRISKSHKAVEFITKFFEPKQTYQEDIVRKLYDMYRHGLVHLYQPKNIRLSTRRVLTWYFYRGKRHIDEIKVGTSKGPRVFKNVDHLDMLRDPMNKNIFYLVICIDALYEDFVRAVRLYREKLKNTKYLQTNWRTTVNAICKPQ